MALEMKPLLAPPLVLVKTVPFPYGATEDGARVETGRGMTVAVDTTYTMLELDESSATSPETSLTDPDAPDAGVATDPAEAVYLDGQWNPSLRKISLNIPQ